MLNRLDEALRHDLERARAALQDATAESVTLQPDKSGKFLWAEYEMKTAALLGVAGSGESLLVVAGARFGNNLRHAVCLLVIPRAAALR
jgi:DNA-binding transcriptional MocR family regulator